MIFGFSRQSNNTLLNDHFHRVKTLRTHQTKPFVLQMRSYDVKGGGGGGHLFSLGLEKVRGRAGTRMKSPLVH